jgi:serine/threonine-protein kinase
VRSVKVPDVVGMDQDAAIAALQQLGFLVGVITQKDPLHIGIVLSESPSAGTKVDLGSDVTITVGSKH